MVINAVAFDHAVSSGTGQGKAKFCGYHTIQIHPELQGLCTSLKIYCALKKSVKCSVLLSLGPKQGFIGEDVLLCGAKT